MAGPCCSKCGSQSITWTSSSQGGISGIMVYCSSCGAVISWSPKPQ